MRFAFRSRAGVPFILPILALLVLLLGPPCAHALETVCIQCHGSQPGKGGAPVGQWRGSIHEENGISCHDCHGGDPSDAVNAMSPARGFIGAPAEQQIPAFCGRCHVGISEDYLKSAHGKALGTGGPTCVTCHGSHRVTAATLDIINENRCGMCHSYERAAAIKDAMTRTEAMIAGIDAKIRLLKGEGVDTDSRGKSLFALRNTFRRLFHEVDTARVGQESGRIRSELSVIEQSLALYDQAKQRRKFIGAIVVGALLLAALFSHLLKKTWN